MKFTLAFVLVIALSNARLGMKQQMTVLAELDSRPIGNMILSQLQIHLASEGVVDDVVSLVNGLIEELNAAQAVDDAKHNSDVVTCEEQLTTSTAKVASHTAAAATARQTVADTETLLANAEQELVDTIDNIAELERLIAEGTALRAEQAAAFVVLTAKHKKQVEALSEAITLVGNLHSGGSFIQLKGKLAQVTDKLQALEQLDQFDSYGIIIESLVQLTTSSSAGDAVGEILTLLKALRTQIEDAQAAAEALEDQRIASWAKELNDLTTQRHNAVSRKGVLETNIDNYKKIIVDNSTSAEMHDEEAARFQELHDTWEVDCHNKQMEYDTTTAARSADLDVLGRLQTYLAEHVSTMEDYLMERVN